MSGPAPCLSGKSRAPSLTSRKGDYSGLANPERTPLPLRSKQNEKRPRGSDEAASQAPSSTQYWNDGGPLGQL
jgi:hypothetical protein